mmetsp:Transcript_229/g.462  ORF Transcript_229/g.462 Transcript_229/m.462 type:complete len:213 (+) Transcript_229:1433-2071(+)
MTQSVPSKTALATSVASARVGRGLLIIDSSICVAVMTGLPATLHLRIIIFWARNTFSGGISMPISPLATIMPSHAARISSKFFRPCWFSILEIILISFPSGPNASLMTAMSAAQRTNEAAIMSTPIFTPNARSSRSFLVIVSMSTSAPGQFMFFFSPSLKSFWAVQMTWSSCSSSTFKVRPPSATRIWPPGETLSGRFAHDTAIVPLLPFIV